MRIICGATVYREESTLGCVSGVTVHATEDRISTVYVRPEDGADGCLAVPFRALSASFGAYLTVHSDSSEFPRVVPNTCRTERERMNHWLDTLEPQTETDAAWHSSFAVVTDDDRGEFTLTADGTFSTRECACGALHDIVVDAGGYVVFVTLRTAEDGRLVTLVPAAKRERDEVVATVHNAVRTR